MSAEEIRELNKDIKEASFRPVYCLYGDEDYLRLSYKNRIRQAVVGDDTMNLSVFTEKEADVNAIIDACDTMPFFAERRLVIVEDSGLFKREADKLVEYLDRIPETAVLVFCEASADKRSRLFKKIASVGLTVEMARQSENELTTWVLRILKSEGKQITRPAMELFLEMAGEDMQNIRSELDKLISYVGEKTGITPEDVKAVCSTRTEGRIFEMIAAMSVGKQKQALDLYYDLLTLKEPPVRILFLISRQMSQMLAVKEAMQTTRDKNTVAKMCGMNSFAVGKLMTQASAFSAAQLKDGLNLCVSTEHDIKSGKLSDVLGAELLIIALSGKRK